jgi:hypothetical protein
VVFLAACSLRLAAATIRLRLRLLQYFSLYGLQLQQSKQLQQCRLAASRTRPLYEYIRRLVKEFKVVGFGFVQSVVPVLSDIYI